MVERQRLLSGFKGEEREILARALDLAENVERFQQPQYTDFFDPYHAGLIISALSGHSLVRLAASGGYPAAERRRVVMCPDYWEPEDFTDCFTVLLAKGSFGNSRPSHRDYLGSLLALGLKRGKLGDIIVNGDSAYMVVDIGVSSFIRSNLVRVSRWEVCLEEVSPEEIIFPQKEYREINAAVASLRLDSVSASGFGLSRSKTAAMISSGMVQLNWKTITDVSCQVKEGDTISFKGRGRVEVSGVKGLSRSGRIFVTLKRIL